MFLCVRAQPTVDKNENGFHDTQIHFWFQGDSCLTIIHMQQTFWLVGSVIGYVLCNIAVSPKILYIIKWYGNFLLKITE
jgi:hypothetical protein